MKLKVKIRDTKLTIEKVTIDAGSTVAELVTALARQDLVNESFTGGLKVKGLEDEDLMSVTLHHLFGESERAEIYNTDMTITLTERRVKGNTLAGRILLDYSNLLETAGKLHELTEVEPVRAGTLFYVQQQRRQYFIRMEDAGLEFFHFRDQYDDAFSGTGRSPFLRVELKERSALTPDELKWLRSITLPAKEKKNPVIHFDPERLSQEFLDDINVLIHRIVVIIGRFRTRGEALDARGRHIPAYVQVGEECSVGYIPEEQLEKIRK
ncbi:hypothetical protein WN59_10365 [Salinicoccus sediminis]|uniref:Uncharacterized protein n=1 Tax=Salinicoccus sediminis TaxID=1432562 RepID=A0A0M2SI83_9STAP|nr:hypothetical protein [Salinicoccus sediminis]KKK33993.1 hypothetical protein WN59_10365 [Salinicoccus sediminis]